MNYHNLRRTYTRNVVRQYIEPTRYACILYYQVSKICFLLEKSTKKTFIIMETKPMNQTNEIKTTIHTYEQGEPCYPFAILEVTETNNETGDTKQTFEPILGNTRICEIPFKAKQMAEDYIRSKPYDLILALIIHTMEMKEKFEKEQQELLKSKENETK